MEKMQDIGTGNGAENNPEKEETIKEFEDKLKALKNKVYNKAEEVFSDEWADWIGEEEKAVRNKLIELENEGRTEDNDFYVAWHVFGGSSVLGDEIKKLKNKDFPGEHSVEVFYNDLLKELNDIQEFEKRKGATR